MSAVFSPDFYLSENGVTVMCPDASIGDRGTMNGLVYTKRNRNQLRDLVEANRDNDVEKTCVSNIMDMRGMFEDSSFAGDLRSWDVSKVISMGWMFEQSSFDGDISSWSVSNVTDMSLMFYNSSFNGDISGWDVSNVTEMRGMFWHVSSFNQDLSGWCVEKFSSQPDYL